MSDYLRTTRECALSEARPELQQAVLDHFRIHALGDPAAGAGLCYETVSRRKSRGRFMAWLTGEMDATFYTLLLLTREWLIWARQGDRSGLHLMAARVAEVKLAVHNPLLPWGREPGLDILADVSDAPSRAQGYIALENEALAQKFAEALKQARLDLGLPAPARSIFGIRWK